MKVSQFRVGSRRFVALVGDHEIPVRPLANAFIYDYFLNASFSTKVRCAQELKLVLEYFSSISIDIEGRVASGSFLTASEVSAFYGVMRLRKEAFGSLDKVACIPTSPSSKFIRNAMSASLFVSNKVDSDTTAGRVRTLRKFIAYLYEYFHGDRAAESLALRFDAMIVRLRSKERYSNNKPTITNSSVTLSEKVIPDKAYDEFHEIIQPSSKRNPFTASRLRNYLILSVIDQAGIRRSEACKLKISDCLFHGNGNKIKVYSSPDDPTDPRLNRPDKKIGRPHLSGIEPSLMKEIAYYIKHVRSTFERAKDHDFIFVSEKDTHRTAGLPLTRNMVNHMMSKVSVVIGFKINPHLLRHKWNERLSEKGDVKGIDRQRIEDMRTNAMGWQPNSKMGRVYNEKHEQMAAAKLMTEHQESIDGTEAETLKNGK